MTTETSVTTKGQMVIPAKLRRSLNIKQGTRLVLIEKKGAFVVRPITAATIDSLRGMLKTKPGEKPVTQQLLEDRAEDLKHEEVRV